jgi:hypothetical protein
VVPAAPRYDPRLVEALRALDDPGLPIAETCRRVGRFAESAGLPRPSYVHVRRLVGAERARLEAERTRREAIRKLVLEVAGDLMVGRRVNPYEFADRLEDLRAEAPD